MVWEPSSPSKYRDESGRKIIEGYKILESIGEGSFATVKRCEKDGCFYAIKIFRKMRLKISKNYVLGANGRMQVETALDKVRNEIDILKTIDSENVSVLRTILDFENKIYLVFDLCASGVTMDWDSEAKSYFVPNTKDLLSQETSARYVVGILLGLEYLHRKRIAHRDIKPQNLLIHEQECKICDFTCATYLDEGDYIVKPGTDGTHCFYPPEYCGPTTNLETPRLRFSGVKVDIWCVGVSLHAFLFGKIPFYDECVADLFESIHQANIPDLPAFSDVSDICMEFLLLLLRKDPSERPNATDLLAQPFGMLSQCKT